MDDLEEDFMLMCKNAQQYNIEQSLIFQDSFTLQRVFKELRPKIENGEDLGIEEPDYESDKESSISSLSKSGRGKGKKKKSRLLQLQDSDDETNDSIDYGSDVSDGEDTSVSSAVPSPASTASTRRK